MGEQLSIYNFPKWGLKGSTLKCLVNKKSYKLPDDVTGNLFEYV